MLWEVFSYGEQPFGWLSNHEVAQAVIEGKEKLPQPHGCPDSIYELMKACWHRNPSRRPATTALLSLIKNELGSRRPASDSQTFTVINERGRQDYHLFPEDLPLQVEKNSFNLYSTAEPKKTSQQTKIRHSTSSDSLYGKEFKNEYQNTEESKNQLVNIVIESEYQNNTARSLRSSSSSLSKDKQH